MKGQKRQKHQGQLAALGRVLRYIRPYWGYLVLSLLTAALQRGHPALRPHPQRRRH